MDETKVVRDIRFDVLKGIATLLVVFGHVLQFSILGHENSLIFNIIWSIQIPLFMIVSGYFSLSIKTSIKKLFIQLFRYLWPCVTYFIIVIIVFHYQNPLQSAFDLLWHLEGTLWYLVVLAFLSVYNFIATSITKKTTDFVFCGVLYSVVFFGLTILFAIPGLKFGLTFLGIKYVLYYSVFYWLGHMWHYCDKINFSGLDKATEIVFSVFALVYFYIINNVNLYNTDDTVLGILPRVLASICGVYIICYCIMKIKNFGKISHFLSGVGINSLEIYYIHCILVRFFSLQQIEMLSLKGILTLVINSVFVLFATYIVIFIIKKSGFFYSILFGSKLKRTN